MLPEIRTLGVNLRKQFPKEVVDELAIPSYTHSNPLMRHLFWQRLAVALEWVDSLGSPIGAVLDFGSGLGILTPPLQRRSVRVIGCDIHPEVTLAGAKQLGATATEVIDARVGIGQLPDRSIGAVLALDVLEHIEDVTSLAGEFARVLSPGGKLLCSLPTENALYRLGRRLAGFSGGYHLHQPARIVAAVAQAFRLRRVARLYPGMPLFDFYEGEVVSGAAVERP